MFSTVLLVGLLFALLTVILIRLSQPASIRNSYGRPIDDHFGLHLTIVLLSVAFGFLLFPTFLIPASIANDNIYQYNKVNDKIELAEGRKVEYQKIIESNLDQYPEYEKLVISEIDPQILLQYPDLKTDKVLMAKVNALIAINDEVYILNQDKLNLRKEIDSLNNSPWVVTWIWWPDTP